jgi:hypothetical protein
MKAIGGEPIPPRNVERLLSNITGINSEPLATIFAINCSIADHNVSSYMAMFSIQDPR